MKAKYIQINDFVFKNVEILNCFTENQLIDKIKNNDVLIIKSYNDTIYINSRYIMFFTLDKYTVHKITK